MAKYSKRTFSNLQGGITEEYSAKGHILAYVDRKDGKASVTVFDPSSSFNREYRGRSVEIALGIAHRHLQRNGYTELED